MGAPTIRTERLIIRDFVDEDRAPFAAINADPAVVEFLQGPMTTEQTDGFIDRIRTCWADNGWGLWAVEVPGVSPFIGYVGLWPADHVQPGMVEVGWRLARAQWGHGYATEAALEAVRFGFEEVGLDEIVSFTVPENRSSWRVMDKIGLIREPDGDFDHSNVDPVAFPHLVRHVFYRLPRSEWQDRRKDAASSE